jgi:hypothetical protein
MFREHTDWNVTVCAPARMAVSATLSMDNASVRTESKESNVKMAVHQVKIMIDKRF